MLKSILVIMMGLFAMNANAQGLEIQISPSVNGMNSLAGGGGTKGGITMWDDGTNDGTDWALGAEVYYGMGGNLQVGGLIGLADYEAMSDMMMQLGVLARYNLSEEMRDAMFVGGGVIYSDFGDTDSISVAIQAGKRFALSDTLTWTPNLTVMLNVAGDVDEGHTINLNILSFSGFMEM